MPASDFEPQIYKSYGLFKVSTAAENYLVSPFIWDADHLPDDC